MHLLAVSNFFLRLQVAPLYNEKKEIGLFEVCFLFLNEVIDRYELCLFLQEWNSAAMNRSYVLAHKVHQDHLHCQL
jgi:hypothetical protein